jgi:hypothetical protein
MAQGKQITVVVTLLVIAVLGWKTLSYFLDSTPPEVQIAGIEAGNYYCGDVQCSVSTNKSGYLSVSLDGQPLLTHFKVKSGRENPFSIPTRTLVNGQHALRLELIDATYHKNKSVLEQTFNADNAPLQAAFVKPDNDNKVFQGRTLRLQFQVNKPIKEAKVQALSHTYECFPESKDSLVYETLIPIECEEAPNEYLLSVQMTDYVGNMLNLDNKFQVVMYPFKQQRLQVTKEKLQEEKSLGLAAAQEREKKFNELAQQSPKEKLWRGTFCMPIEAGRTTCEFGTVRTTQEKGRYMHKAVDLANMPRSVVWATQSGKVVLKERFEDTGNTVVVDHGWGLLSLFYHLEDFASIEVGQKVAQGNPLGTLGKTGYATGYHLHWEMRKDNIAVDPMQWVKPTF